PADEKSQSDQNPERMPPQQPSISTPKAQEPNPGTPNNRSSIPPHQGMPMLPNRNLSSNRCSDKRQYRGPHLRKIF
ncbi:hypothetical protein, partial [Gluconobacter oxydans]|uniref:hypothetical protein n=1 Tax=Gluconobacter oxydans TaxID=442 RepID=UPI001CD83348